MYLAYPPIKIRRQRRKTFMMRVVRGTIEVYIPHWYAPDHPRVVQFIDQALLQWWDGEIPPIPEDTITAQDLLNMVTVWSDRLGVEPGRVQIREMRRKWGSCSGKNNITLNRALLRVPRHLAEYIVAHELVHLRVFDHSPTFWAILAEHMPDYQERKDELDSITRDVL